MEAVQFLQCMILWIFLLGWVINIWSIRDAFLFKAKS